MAELAMNSYPPVVGEIETLDAICAGKSIARYGDGELNLLRGGNCVSQRRCPGIKSQLASILITRRENLLVGIPTLDSRSPKFYNWSRIAPKFVPFLNKRMIYHSAFITRPDSAPWIATEEYYDKIESLWAGKDITMVYGSKRSLHAEFKPLERAKSIAVVETPYSNSFVEIDRIESDIHKAKNHAVLLMCGPTATVLAARLSDNGYHAIDLGHIGLWWRAHLNPKLTKHLVYMR